MGSVRVVVVPDEYKITSGCVALKLLSGIFYFYLIIYMHS